MSKLEQLINELCLEGVEYRALGELGDFYSGLSGKSKNDFTNGNAKFITYMNVFSNLSLKIDVDDKVKIAENEHQNTIQYGDILFTGSSETPEECGMASVLTSIKYEKLYLNSFCFGFMCYDKNLMIPEFSKYVFRSSEIRKQIKRTASGVTRFNVSKKKMEKVIIPLPPLPVQEEIIRILDKFTELTAELTTKLTAELTARKQQYEYYKDELLTFEYNSVSWHELNDVIISLNTGLNPRRFFRLNTEDATNYYVTIREIRDGRVVPTNKTDRINDKALALCNNRSNLEIGDVLFSGTGTIGETAVIMEYPQNWNIKEGVYAIKPNQKSILPKFLRYLLTATYIKTAYMKKVAGGTVKSIPMGELRKLKIPVPSLEKQNCIVAILERFDKLCNDISEGLPAEIEARQKQYEYYLDKLLTFKKKEAAENE